MGQNPEGLPKARSNAHVQAIIVWKSATVNSHARAQSSEILSVDSPLTSRTFGADLRTLQQIRYAPRIKERHLMLTHRGLRAQDSG